MNNVQAALRELINQHITPEQEREWLTYWARRAPEETLASEEQRASFRQIARDYHKLMKQGAAPDSDAVQAVTQRSMRTWLDGNLRQRQLEQLAWNPEVTRAWFSLASKLLTRSVVPDDPAEAERLREFINAARAVSRTAQVLTPIVREAMRLRSAGVKPNAAEAKRLGAQYAQVCKDEGYGDPRMHARWLAEFAELPQEAKAGWDYLAHL